MSTWDFLQGFYKRVDAAHQHSQRLEYDLYRVTERSKFSIAEFQRLLAATQTQLDEERLEHTATREQLEFEGQRHRETEKLFDLTYEAAMESNGLVDSLRAQITELQGNRNISGTVPKTEDLMHELQVTKGKLKSVEDWLSVNNANVSGQSSSIQHFDDQSQVKLETSFPN